MILQEVTVPTPASTKAKIGISLHARNEEDFIHSQVHVYMLSDEERDEVKTAMLHFKGMFLLNGPNRALLNKDVKLLGSMETKFHQIPSHYRPWERYSVL
jgi:hypothetical protein